MSLLTFTILARFVEADAWVFQLGNGFLPTPAGLQPTQVTETRPSCWLFASTRTSVSGCCLPLVSVLEERDVPNCLPVPYAGQLSSCWNSEKKTTRAHSACSIFEILPLQNVNPWEIQRLLESWAIRPYDSIPLFWDSSGKAMSGSASRLSCGQPPGTAPTWHQAN